MIGNHGPQVRSRLAAVGGVVLCLLIGPACSSCSAQESAEFRPIRLVKEFPAIRDAPVIPADKVQEEVHDDELVIGVVVNGKARAYPINMLTGPSREIINDKLGGQAIAATW